MPTPGGPLNFFVAFSRNHTPPMAFAHTQKGWGVILKIDGGRKCAGNEARQQSIVSKTRWPPAGCHKTQQNERKVCHL